MGYHKHRPWSSGEPLRVSITRDTGGRAKTEMAYDKSFIAVVGERKTGNIISHETSYHVSTTELTLELTARATRQHWHTENCQHWILDVVFKEDEQTIYAGQSAVNMACFWRFVLNLLRRDNKKLSMPRKMNKAAWDGKFRHDILFTNELQSSLAPC